MMPLIIKALEPDSKMNSQKATSPCGFGGDTTINSFVGSS